MKEPVKKADIKPGFKIIKKGACLI